MKTDDIQAGEPLAGAICSEKYRDLEKGEALQDGDEYWNPRRGEWRPYDSRLGLIVGCVYAPFKYRRPISLNHKLIHGYQRP